MKRFGCLILTIFMLAAVFTGCTASEDVERTKELIVGIWDYIPEGENYKYRYSFTESGTITQAAWGIDENGNEIDISLGDTFGLVYEVIDADTITIKGTFSGVTSEPEKIPVAFPDENTMVLGNSTYTRFGSE